MLLQFECKSITFSKIDVVASSVNIFQFLFKNRIATIQAFPMRYISFFYLKRIKRYQLSKFEALKKPPFYKVNMRIFRFFELCQLVSFDLLEVQKLYIPQLKGLNSGYWNLEWKLKKICFGKFQINFSEKGPRFILKGVAVF